MIDNLDFVQSKYYNFIKNCGYLPRAFCAYDMPNGSEHFEIHPALTTRCGGTGCNSQVFVAIDSRGGGSS